MSNTTAKPTSDQDGFGALKHAFNDQTGVPGVESWVQGFVGRKIELESTDEVQVITFSENGTVLCELTLTYTDSSQETLVSVERTA